MMRSGRMMTIKAGMKKMPRVTMTTRAIRARKRAKGKRKTETMAPHMEQELPGGKDVDNFQGGGE